MTKTALLRKRADKAFRDLVRWQRKMKMAAAKVDHYLKRVVYYRRFLAEQKEKAKQRRLAGRHLIVTD